ncbi:MAG: sensor histidine kinase, partial [Deltaproteobacteria bacterium]|nr:sensor histidine kinase [Deltaproteobacteria bacterium]
WHAIAIVRDITERKVIECELKQSREQLRRLTTYIQSAVERERAKISRAVHDELGQMMTALKIDLYWIGKQLQGDQPVVNEKIRSMSCLIDKTIESLHKITSELRSDILDELGLDAALEWQIHEFRCRTGIDAVLRIDSQCAVKEKDLSLTIYRIFQEAMTNIVRHAAATKVEVTVRDKDGSVELEVKDNGKGISEEKIRASSSFGLMSMRERSYSLGGSLGITGERDKGTTVLARLPLSQEAINS